MRSLANSGGNVPDERYQLDHVGEILAFLKLEQGDLVRIEPCYRLVGLLNK